MSRQHDPSAAGFFAALAAFTAWGLLPAYWKLLKHVGSVEVLCHRIVWSLAFLALVITWKKRWPEVFAPLGQWRNLGLLALSSATIGLNWLTYIWAVNNDHILETSIGYYICPLVSMILGFLFFKERLRRIQLVAIGLAVAGVGVSVAAYGQFPWIAMVLAVSFGAYGMLRKLATVESMPGLLLETAVLSPLCLGYLAWLGADGTGAFLTAGAATDLLLIGAGVMTTMPLVWFAYGARRLRLSTIGLLQYMAPSIAFVLGVFVYHEPFTAAHLVTFGLIWAALVIYSVESVLFMRAHRSPRTR